MAEAVKGLPPEIADHVLSSIAFTASPAIAQLGEMGRQLVEAARTAFVGGVGDAVLVASGVMVVAAIAIFVLAPSASSSTVAAADARAAA
jgi:hypothetical protein